MSESALQRLDHADNLCRVVGAVAVQHDDVVGVLGHGVEAGFEGIALPQDRFVDHPGLKPAGNSCRTVCGAVVHHDDIQDISEPAQPDLGESTQHFGKAFLLIMAGNDDGYLFHPNSFN